VRVVAKEREEWSGGEGGERERERERERARERENVTHINTQDTTTRCDLWPPHGSTQLP